MSTVPGHDGFGPVTAQSLPRFRQVAAQRLQAAWTQIPHVTHHEEADVTAADAARRQRNAGSAGQKLTLLAYVARATVLAIEAHPAFCASLDPDGRTLWLKGYLNLGIAVETPRGLVVAVVPAAGSHSVTDLGLAIGDLAARGRAGTLKPTEVEGSCFTISSLGNLGGVGFTPIINPPNVAILGVAQARMRPEWIDGQVAPRLILPLSLSYDHRVIDGADAARFCNTLRAALAEPACLGD